MRVGVGLQSRGLGTLVSSPHLGPAQKETLFGSEAVEIFGARLPFQRFFVGGVGNSQAAEIADAFAEHELTVLMQPGLDFVGVKLFAIAGSPPVTQISFPVELRSLVVEAVGDFMPDYRAHAAVIDGIVSFR